MKRDHLGRYYLLRPWGWKDSPAVFDANGRFLIRMGGVGAGPGEFLAPRLIAFGPTDSIFVFDLSNARISVFSPALRFVRSAPVSAHIFSAAWAGDGRIAISALANDAARFGKPLHFLDVVGKYVSSFGEDVGKPFPPGSDFMLNREVASAKGGGIWAADIWGSYRLQRFDSRGVLQMEIVRRADWFPEGKGPADIISPDLPPFPSVAAVVEDSAGLVLVFVRVADKRWPTALTVRKPTEDEPLLESVPSTHDVTDADAAYDTTIEVFDPVRRVLVASTRVDKLFRFSVGPSRVGHLQLASDGSLIPEIWTVRLAR